MRTLILSMFVATGAGCGKEEKIEKAEDFILSGIPGKDLIGDRLSGQTDSQLVEYVERFERDLGLAINFPVVFGGTVSFPAIKSVGLALAGYCEMLPGKMARVVINRTSWDKIPSDLEKEYLLYHELGHCKLGRGHNNKKITVETVINGEKVPIDRPASIMANGWDGWGYNFYKENRQAYLDELRNENGELGDIKEGEKPIDTAPATEVSNNSTPKIDTPTATPPPQSTPEVAGYIEKFEGIFNEKVKFPIVVTPTVYWWRGCKIDDQHPAACISNDLWDGKSDAYREWLVFRILGRYTLGQDYRNDVKRQWLSDNWKNWEYQPLTIMFETEFSEAHAAYYAAHRQDFWDELANPREYNPREPQHEPQLAEYIERYERKNNSLKINFPVVFGDAGGGVVICEKADGWVRAIVEKRVWDDPRSALATDKGRENIVDFGIRLCLDRTRQHPKK